MFTPPKHVSKNFSPLFGLWHAITNDDLIFCLDNSTSHPVQIQVNQPLQLEQQDKSRLKLVQDSVVLIPPDSGAG